MNTQFPISAGPDKDKTKFVIGATRSSAIRLYASFQFVIRRYKCRENHPFIGGSIMLGAEV